MSERTYTELTDTEDLLNIDHIDNCAMNILRNLRNCSIGDDVWWNISSEDRDAIFSGTRDEIKKCIRKENELNTAK
jgi:hypothetical protein